MSYVYKIVNNINSKFYYGVHSRNQNHYYGSGLLIVKAIKKYGKSNFTKTIIFKGAKEDCYDIEELILSEELISGETCYNLALGGLGGITLTGDAYDLWLESLIERNKKPWTQERKDKISKANKGRPSKYKGVKRPGVGGRPKGCKAWNKGLKKHNEKTQ